MRAGTYSSVLGADCVVCCCFPVAPTVLALHCAREVLLCRVRYAGVTLGEFGDRVKGYGEEGAHLAALSSDDAEYIFVCKLVCEVPVVHTSHRHASCCRAGENL